MNLIFFLSANVILKYKASAIELNLCCQLNSYKLRCLAFPMRARSSCSKEKPYRREVAWPRSPKIQGCIACLFLATERSMKKFGISVQVSWLVNKIEGIKKKTALH